MPRAALLLASATALLAPQSPVTPRTVQYSTTLNPLEQLAEQAQIKAYEASAAAIAATISAKVAEKGDRMPDGMVPIVQEFMRTYLDVVAKQKRDPMEKVPTQRPVVQRSRHQGDSCPSHNEVGGFFSDFEAVRRSPSSRSTSA